jgi:hypothetical protein
MEVFVAALALFPFGLVLTCLSALSIVMIIDIVKSWKE